MGNIEQSTPSSSIAVSEIEIVFGNSGSAAMSVINGKNVSINSDLTAECRNPQQFRYVLVLPFPL